jgi:MSHA biogenesis protein MshN
VKLAAAANDAAVKLAATADHSPVKLGAATLSTPAPKLAAAEAAVATSATAKAPPTAASAAAPDTRAQIDKRVQQPSAQQLAENEFRDATALFHQGRLAEAQEKFRLALQHLPGHSGARQALFGLLLDAKRFPEAEHVVQEGLRIGAEPRFAVALARMQVDRGDTAGAIETLQKNSYAAHGSADYTAFLAALLQRQARHGEAVEHYQAALALAPGNGLWSMGLGISLQALNRNAEARAAFRRALASSSLNAELHAFVDQQLRQLQELAAAGR